APFKANAKFGGFWNSQALGTTPRIFKGNRLQGGATLGHLYFNFGPVFTAGGLDDNVLDRFVFDWANPSPPTISNHVFTNTAGDDGCFTVSGNPFPTFDGSYLYYDGGNHVFGSMVGAITFQNNICECRLIGSAGNAGANWLLYGAAAATGNKVNANTNLFLGTGTPLSITGSFAQDIDFKGNTIFVSFGQTSFPNAADFGALETEQAG